MNQFQRIKQCLTHEQFSFYLVSRHNALLNGNRASSMTIDTSYRAGITCVWF